MTPTISWASRAGSSDEDVRRAYLKLVKELHPDVNPAKSAEERFKKVTAAHDILGDPERRRQFDRGEIDAWATHAAPAYRSQPRGARARTGQMFEEFGDVFSDFFAGVAAAMVPAGAPSRRADATSAIRSTSISSRPYRAPRSASACPTAARSISRSPKACRTDRSFACGGGARQV